MKTGKFGTLLAALALTSLTACGQFGGAAEEKTEAAKDGEHLALAGPNAAASGTVEPAAAAGPDFGDDNGKYARDGECDDKRFAGPGMTNTPLLDEDVSHDATDCRAAFKQGRLTLASSTQADPSRIQWGDDNGAFANDGECDDKRFEGAGMTTTPLLDSDIRHDATDCRVAYEQGRLTFRGDKTADFSEVDASHIQWGDDDGSFAKDGECDDMRFEGPGMTSTRLLDSDVKHDATDCRVAFQQGRLALRR
jgi:hypothetical protein